MAMPQAVAQQIEAAEALQQQLYPQEGSEPAPEAAPPAPAEPEAEPASNVVPLPQAAEPAPQAEAPKQEQRDEAAYWKQRFDTVQGILNAEMPKLHLQLKEQSQTLKQLQEAKPSPEPQSEPASSKDVEDFGADLVDMTRRVAADVVRGAIAQEVAKLRQEFGAMQEQVGQVSEQVAMSASDRFWAGVMSLVPDWKAVDADPQWVAFLDTTPEFAEDTYRELATKAIQKGDAAKIAKLVELWRGPQRADPAPQPSAQAELQRQVAPSTSRASSSTPPAGKVWTGAEYKAAMDVRNVQRYGQKEADRMEAEANLAQAERRVRW
ncbi:MAG: hypothetical protein WBO46_01495 [Caldilineaceae bacterium]